MLTENNVVYGLVNDAANAAMNDGLVSHIQVAALRVGTPATLRVTKNHVAAATQVVDAYIERRHAPVAPLRPQFGPPALTNLLVGLAQGVANDTKAEDRPARAEDIAKLAARVGLTQKTAPILGVAR